MHDFPTAEFGTRLRLARSDLGLSQAEVAGDAYSASYISHLESGRRQPTAEVVQHLTSQLGLDSKWLWGDEEKQSNSTHRDAELAALEVRVHNAAVTRDYKSVLGEIEKAEFAADEHPSLWWGIRWSQAESQLALGSYEDCRITATELASRRLATVSPELRAAALALTSRAERAAGHLERALLSARDAVRADSLPAQCRAVSLRELVASLAELGRFDEAAEASSELESFREEIIDLQLLGLIAWTIGNVAYLTGDASRGAVEHNTASDLLRPEADLRLWGRFHKASAAMRLQSGSIDGVDFAIGRAAIGLELAGNTSDHAELCLLRAERALIDDPEAALRLAVEGLGTTMLPSQTHAEGLVIQARALQALGRHGEARSALNDSALSFDSVGAHRRSAEIWRELATKP